MLTIAGGILLAVFALAALRFVAAALLCLIVLVLALDHPVIAGLLFAAWCWAHIQHRSQAP